MTKKNQNKLRRQEESFSAAATISFPARFRVRCPRCGCDRQPPRNTGEPGHYLCESTDDSQSATCVSRAKEKRTENLVADARDILGKLGFGAPARTALPSYLRLVN